VDQRGDCDDGKSFICGVATYKTLNVPRNNTNGSDYTKGFFPELFSWIRIRIQKGFYNQENAVEKKAKYGGGGRQKVSVAGYGFEIFFFFYRIRIQKAKTI
jgi:hypothetical protein